MAKRDPAYGRTRHTVYVEAGEWEPLHSHTTQVQLQAYKLAERRFCHPSIGSPGQVRVSGNLRLELPSQRTVMMTPIDLEVAGNVEIVRGGPGPASVLLNSLTCGGSLVCRESQVALSAKALKIRHALDWAGLVSVAGPVKAGQVLCSSFSAASANIGGDLITWGELTNVSGEVTVRGSLLAFGEMAIIPSRAAGHTWWEYRAMLRREAEQSSVFLTGDVTTGGPYLRVHGELQAGRLRASSTHVQVGNGCCVRLGETDALDVRGEIRCHHLRAARIWAAGLLFATGTVRSDARITADRVEAKRIMAGVGLDAPWEECLIRARSCDGQVYAGQFHSTLSEEEQNTPRTVVLEG